MSTAGRREMGNIEAIVRQAAEVLARSWGPLRLSQVGTSQQGRRNLLIRCKVLGAPAPAPPSVVVKWAQAEGYNPDVPLAAHQHNKKSPG